MLSFTSIVRQGDNNVLLGYIGRYELLRSSLASDSVQLRVISTSSKSARSQLAVTTKDRQSTDPLT